METLPNIADAAGLRAADRSVLIDLLDVARARAARNALRTAYYDEEVEPPDIGVSNVPEGVGAHVPSGWPRKAVTSVAERSRFDGFVLSDGGGDPSLDRVVRDNALVDAYRRHVPSELNHGCMFATVGRHEGRAIVRYHTAEQAAGLWDEGAGRLGAGLVVADRRRTPWSRSKPQPVRANLHMPGYVVALQRTSQVRWSAEYLRLPIDRPMMEAFAFRADGGRPFGTSRITRSVMAIADEAMRLFRYLSVAAAFYSVPMRAFLGLTEEQFDAMRGDKWRWLMDSVFLAERGGNGEVPQAVQLAAASPQPLVEQFRIYAQQFSAETGVPLNSLGVTTDNPSSAQAIAAAREDICIAADDLNTSNKVALRNVALMAMCVEGDCPMEGLTERQLSVQAHFADPSMPSVVSQADAATKLAKACPGFADTDVFWEMCGFSQEDVARIQSQKSQSAGLTALRERRAAADGAGNQGQAAGLRRGDSGGGGGGGL